MRLQRSAVPAVSIGALIILAINLRPALTCVGPLIGDIRQATAISSTAAGALTSLPLVALGVFAPLGHLGRRYGTERTLVLAMLLLIAGSLVRSSGSALALFGGSLCLACGIAIGNTLVPSIIKRDFPDRIKGLTTVYAIVLGLTAAISAGLAVPLAAGLPGGWRAALAIWAVPACVAVAAWLPAAARCNGNSNGLTLGASHAADIPQRLAPARSVWRAPLAWMVAGFMGLQSLFFYTAMSWFPAFFQSQGYAAAEAGFLVAEFQFVSLSMSAVLPWLLRLTRDQSAFAAAASLAITVAACGMLAWPGAGYLWMTVMGMGAGVTLPLGLAFMSLRAGSHAQAASLSIMSQTVGYLVAAAGPFAFGLIHDLSGAWTLSLCFLVVLGLAQTFIGLRAGRDRTL
jgi:CP family cyanate transporter-like MFS transporter